MFLIKKNMYVINWAFSVLLSFLFCLFSLKSFFPSENRINTQNLQYNFIFFSWMHWLFPVMPAILNTFGTLEPVRPCDVFLCFLSPDFFTPGTIGTVSWVACEGANSIQIFSVFSSLIVQSTRSVVLTFSRCQMWNVSWYLIVMWLVLC